MRSVQLQQAMVASGCNSISSAMSITCPRRALGTADAEKDVEAPDAKVLSMYEKVALEDGRLER